MAVDALVWRDRVEGLLLGTAAGDAVGLPREGLSPGRAARLFGQPPLELQFFLGRGATSDDTEHACLVAQALLAAPTDPDAFARSLAWRLRGWLLTLPAGIGFATLRAILKLWLGFPPRSSGVSSAGNGAAMRAPLLGIAAGGDDARLRGLVLASTRLTHRDPLAEEGAFLIALAARRGALEGPAVRREAFLAEARALAGSDFRGALDRAGVLLARSAPVADYAKDLGLERGVTGFVLHTVPVVLYGWLATPGDFRRTVESVVALGGDADTTGAIAGALAGATNGARAIPAAWLARLAEWPRSVAWMRRLAHRVADRFPPEGPPRQGEGPLPLFWPGLLVRSAVVLPVVLGHGFRRLLPPY